MILNDQFTLSQVSEAVGRNQSTLRTHINRGYATALGPRSMDASAPGKHARFTFFTMTEFAMAYKIAEIGVTTSQAFKCAAIFAHEGDTIGGWTKDSKADGAPAPRRPGLPYHYALGDTYVVLGQKGASVQLVKKGDHLELREPSIVVPVWEIFRDLVIALGADPFHVLNDAYDIHSGADLEGVG